MISQKIETEIYEKLVSLAVKTTIQGIYVSDDSKSIVGSFKLKDRISTYFILVSDVEKHHEMDLEIKEIFFNRFDLWSAYQQAVPKQFEAELEHAWDFYESLLKKFASDPRTDFLCKKVWEKCKRCVNRGDPRKKEISQATKTFRLATKEALALISHKELQTIFNECVVESVLEA